MPSGSRDNGFWFFIEPYVHITSANGAFLFYNSLTRKSIEIRDDPEAAAVARELLKPANGYVIPLTTSTLEKTGVKKLVNKIRKYYMGDLLDISWSEGKPVNILPEPHIKTKLTRKILGNPEKMNAIDFGNFLHEITLYLASGPSPFSKKYKKAERQFISPTLYGPATRVVEQMDLENWIYQLTSFKLATLNLAGTGMIRYPGLDNLLRIGQEMKVQVRLHIAYDDNVQVPFEQILSGRENRVAFYVTFPVDLDKLNQMITRIAQSGRSGWYELHFVVTSQQELESSFEIIEKSQIPTYFFKPFYNGSNFDFFRENVFITKKDIDSSRPDQNQIFSRLTVNEKDFGKLTILPDGSVFANLNDPSLGNIREHSVPVLILKELMEGKSWKRSRSHVTPCRNCLYHFLCPPISGYELQMHRFNFCDVYEKQSGS